MSAPHVAGAWALLREQNPTATPAQVLAALQNTGLPIADERTGGTLTKPRIRIAGAAAALSGSVPYDDFADARTLAGSDVSHLAHNIGATEETGEPNHGGPDIAGGASVWYEWTAPSSGVFTADTAGSDFDTLLGVYSGTTVGGLTPLARNDDEDPEDQVYTSLVQFNAVAGTTYHLAVDGFKPGDDPARQGDTHINLYPGDDIAPPNPDPIASTSHTVGEWSSDDTVDVEWPTPSDISGIDGYSVAWSTSSTTNPGNSVVLEETETGMTSPALANGGSHYFHLRTRDGAGNWSSALHLGPFRIDDEPPEETEVTAPGRRFQTSHAFDVRWSPSFDALSGLAGYKTEIASASLAGTLGPYATYDTLKGTGFEFVGQEGRTYCFDVYAFDQLDNEGPVSDPACTSVPVDDRHGTIDRNGAWTEKSKHDAFEHTFLESEQHGARLTTDLSNAERVALVVTKCRGCGSVRVLWEGAPLVRAGTNKTVVRLASSKTKFKRVIPYKALPGPSTGRLAVEIVSNNKPVKIDAFGVSKV